MDDAGIRGLWLLLPLHPRRLAGHIWKRYR
jgi:hypothetical protein